MKIRKDAEEQAARAGEGDVREIYRDLFQQFYQEQNPASEPVQYVAPEDVAEELASDEKVDVSTPRNVVLLDEFFNQDDAVKADITLEDGSVISLSKERIRLTTGETKTTYDLGAKEHIHHDENPFDYLPYVVVGEPTKVNLSPEFKKREKLIPSSPVAKVVFQRQKTATREAGQQSPRSSEQQMQQRYRTMTHRHH